MALHGKTILTTRAAAQAGDLGERLKLLHARVVECPTMELEPIENWTAIDPAIARMNSYDWILFTSANAVDFFLKRLAAVHGVCCIPIA
ncbi:MAG TPA: uroporphyrinogen-III synthase, partial [Terriglobia bacterium]|nr:uroporphyrinogen-III synthase [Terriglobia bacterium]